MICHIDQNFKNSNDIRKKTVFTFTMTWATCYLFQFNYAKKQILDVPFFPLHIGTVVIGLCTYFIFLDHVKIL